MTLRFTNTQQPVVRLSIEPIRIQALATSDILGQGLDA
jgi:hypothetical protein